MLKKATFDTAMTNALLAMAAEEGLIVPGPNETDGIFNSVACHPVPDWMRRQVLEQVVLTPTVLTRKDFSWGHLAGQLLDEGHLEHISPASTTLFRLSS